MSVGMEGECGDVHMPPLRFVTGKGDPRLGIEFGLPVYRSYMDNPEAFHFLGHPDGYEDEIMSMLNFVDSL